MPAPEAHALAWSLTSCAFLNAPVMRALYIELPSEDKQGWQWLTLGETRCIGRGTLGRVGRYIGGDGGRGESDVRMGLLE